VFFWGGEPEDPETLAWLAQQKTQRLAQCLQASVTRAEWLAHTDEVVPHACCHLVYHSSQPLLQKRSSAGSAILLCVGGWVAVVGESWILLHHEWLVDVVHGSLGSK